MKSVVISFYILVGFSVIAPAQAPAYSHSTWTSGPAPASVLFNSNDGKIQSLYYPADFQGMPRGFVTNVYLRVNASGNDNLNYKNVRLSLGYSTDSVFLKNGYAYPFQAGLTSVFFSSAVLFTGMKTQGKWIKFKANGNWLYDPAKNFVAEISHGPEGLNNYGGFSWMASNVAPAKIRTISGAKDSTRAPNFSSYFLDLGFDLAPAGLDETSNVKSFGLFPNPSTDGRFVVSMETKSPLGSVTITVTNTAGQVVHGEQINEHGTTLFKEIALGNPAAGLYCVTIAARNERITRSLSIQ